MSEVRLIKKYSNRRLYDTAASRYVNLDQVAALVRRGDPVQVVDAKTGEDLTRQVLTQIIVEDARHHDGGAPVEFLRDMIRATDRAQRDFLEWYLATAAEVYKKLQKTWGDRLPVAAAGTAQWEAWSRLWDPMQAFQSLRGKRAHKPEPPAARSAADDAHDAAPAAAAAETASVSSEAELAELRRRLDALERRLANGD